MPFATAKETASSGTSESTVMYVSAEARIRQASSWKPRAERYRTRSQWLSSRFPRGSPSSSWAKTRAWNQASTRARRRWSASGA